MILSDNEIRDITKLLEAGKPLPDEYRFKLFEEKREVELVWNGKTNEVTDIVLPFQVIEQIDEPREEQDTKLQMGLFDFDERGRQIKGWTNKLIWGDNKLILSSLKNGPLREEIEKEGGIKLIYIDPPFDVGADFSMDIEIGDEQLHKEPSVLEELAYRDTWGKGADSWIAMMYERLQLMRDLLSKDGCIYVHCDYRVNGYARLMMDEVFGKDNFRNEIYARRKIKNIQTQFDEVKQLNIAVDSIFWYSKIIDTRFKVPQKKGGEQNLNQWNNFYNNADRPTLRYPLLGIELNKGQWRWTKDKADEAVKNYQEYINNYANKMSLYDYWLKTGESKRFIKREQGSTRCYYWIPPKDEIDSDTYWGDIYAYDNSPGYYPTQKAEPLLERIINSSSKQDDIILDVFAGSGTTLKVAEKLGRKWIGADLGKFAIHTSRKRLIETQRELKKEGKNYRAFEILNLGKYERQHYIGINPNLSSDNQQKQAQKREKDFVDLILKAYKAERIDGFETFYGKKSGRMVSIGPINLPITRLFVEEVINECIEKKLTKADVLAFEFEMGLFPNIMDHAKDKGIDLALKYIPPDVFDKRAVEKNQVVFHDVCYIEVKPIVKKGSVSVQLIDFSVFYNQESIAQVESLLKNGGNKVVVENGQIIKVSKDKDGIVSKEVLTKKWTDWIDYWAVDFDFENKKEIIRVLKPDAKPVQKRLVGEEDPTQLDFSDYEEKWTGDYIFENEWQSFRTKKNRDIELISISKQLNPGRRKIAVKVVDIFGNDTMKVVEVNI